MAKRRRAAGEPRPMSQPPVMSQTTVGALDAAAAWRRFERTNDDSELVAMGILPPDMKPNF